MRLEKIVFYWLKTTIPAGRVVGWSGGRVGWSGRVGWLDNLEIMLNSVQLSWNLTELGKSPCWNIKRYKNVQRDNFHCF